MSKKTVKILNEVTNWDERGYEYCNTGSKIAFKKGDKVIRFDFNSNAVWIQEFITDIKLPVNTPDGRYFVAFKRLKRYKTKRLTQNFVKVLKMLRIVNKKSGLKYCKKIKLESWKQLQQYFRK
ncbi:MAG: hypothetical protein HY606_12540 [Planctomycetes bacterium]|nr:hypothetical protein [Planctomycetota bacterium]